MEDGPGNQDRKVGIRLADGREFFSSKFFYHCMLAYELNIAHEDVVDTWVGRGWRGSGCLETAQKLKEYWEMSKGIKGREGFIAFMTMRR